MATRLISYSEVSTALDCWARWDFSYGDKLAGSSLKPKATAPLLSAGRAWGAAVAAHHIHIGEIDGAEQVIAAMDASLEQDADRQREFGLHDRAAHRALREELLAMLVHYADVAEPVEMDSLTERELLVAIPSRSGQRSSSRYKLLCYVDATETDSDGDVWLDEFKLRKSLSDVQQITLSRQIRWYAWAYWHQSGRKPVGVWVNERLNAVPRPPRVLKSGKLSHARDQMCTERAYADACEEFGEQPNPDTLEHLRARRWQQRVPVIFRDSELEEAGRELVSAAKLIQMLETEQLEPLRNAKPSNCNRCAFVDICGAPDNGLVEMLFERKPPKRDRDPIERSSR